MIQEGADDYETGIKLLRVQRGAPKNRRFMKLLQEEGIKKLITRVELDYMRDKRMGEIDEALYYSIDERSNLVDMTERGRSSLSPEEQDAFVLPDLSVDLKRIEEDQTLPDEEKAKRQDAAYREHALKSEAIHNVHQLLKAYSLFEKDVQYMVDGGRVIIVDEFTGRPQPGRRYSDGLHQALEAKENVQIEQETQTIATITLQNYFRLYHKLAGMTGTAETESAELFEIYKLDVTVIPTNQPIRRPDFDDLIYRTKREKYNAIIEEIARLHGKEIPVLVGTISVEVSELLSRLLKQRGIRHNVLNARYHQQEAQIVAGAGGPGAVTIATNMAGRGTDIKLGPGVVKAPEGRQCALCPNPKDDRPLCPHLAEYGCREDVPCGLHIIGTERHEARRIDRQLRGRSGRQGDPGSSRFFISLEDDLMRLFGSDRIAAIMDRLGAEEGEVIEHSMVTKSISRAQRRVEARNFEMRKHLLEYDDVMNQQREVIYDRRRHALEQADLSDQIREMVDEVADAIVDAQTNEEDHPEGWNFEGLKADLRGVFLIAPVFREDESISRVEDLKERVRAMIRESGARRERAFGPDQMRQIERGVYLSVIDEKWKEHLYNMDELKEGISFRAYGQRDPLVEYKREAYNLFVELLDEINRETVRTLFRIPVAEEAPRQIASRRRAPERITAVHREVAGFGALMEATSGPAPSEGTVTNAPSEEPVVTQPVRRDHPKVGRNDPCYCGSGKKYKKCHGKGAA
jgi:preprotein translocase subunit SecA